MNDYFPCVNDPYSALKTTLKAEINPEAWATLKSDISRPFEKPKSGRIAGGRIGLRVQDEPFSCKHLDETARRNHAFIVCFFRKMGLPHSLEFKSGGTLC
jgi:hypothetical protein